MEPSAQNPNPIPSVSMPNTALTKDKQIRLLIIAIFLFITSLITSYITLQQRAEQQKQVQSFVKKPQPQPQQSSVVLKKEYKNPFDKNSQYVNPFAQYKNPFDSLK